MKPIIYRLKFFAFLIFCSQFLIACITVVKRSRDGNSKHSFNRYSKAVIKKNMDRKAFERRGPFGYEYKADISITISQDENLIADFMQTTAAGNAPLLIFIHGNNSMKEAHSFQAQRLSTWGFHTLAIDLPNKKQWVENGDRVLRLVNYLKAHPDALSKEIDTSKILLVGHSFGGSASIIAAGSGAPVSGLILLDPAVVDPIVVEKMTKVPVILLGADKEIFKARKRQKFFKYISSPMIELSLVNTTHDEAQFPSICSMYIFGFECYSRENQKLFTSAIAVSAFSLTVSENLNFAWTVFKVSEGKRFIKELKRKGRKLISGN